jgi:hypothetical protein
LPEMPLVDTHLPQEDHTFEMSCPSERLRWTSFV